MSHPTREELSMWASGEVLAQDRQRLASHLQECSTCQKEVAGFSRLVHAVQAMPKVSAPRDLASLVRARRHEPRGFWSFLRPALASPYVWSGAAGAALVLVLVWSQTRDGFVTSWQEALREEGAVSATLIGTGETIAKADIPSEHLGAIPAPKDSPKGSAVVGRRLRPVGPEVDAPAAGSRSAKRANAEVATLTLSDNILPSQDRGRVDNMMMEGANRDVSSKVNEVKPSQILEKGSRDQPGRPQELSKGLMELSRVDRPSVSSVESLKRGSTAVARGQFKDGETQQAAESQESGAERVESERSSVEMAPGAVQGGMKAKGDAAQRYPAGWLQQQSQQASGAQSLSAKLWGRSGGEGGLDVQRWEWEVQEVSVARLQVMQAVTSLSGSVERSVEAVTKQSLEANREGRAPLGMTLRVWIRSDQVAALEKKLAVTGRVTRVTGFSEPMDQALQGGSPQGLDGKMSGRVAGRNDHQGDSDSRSQLTQTGASLSASAPSSRPVLVEIVLRKP